MKILDGSRIFEEILYGPNGPKITRKRHEREKPNIFCLEAIGVKLPK